MPWMQFFYDWRFADIEGDGRIDLILTCGAFRQIAYSQGGAELWVLDIDQDGLAELICARKLEGRLHLCIVNAQDGRVKKSIPYPNLEHIPNDRRGSITIANVSGQAYPADILVGWDYASVTVLDDMTKFWPVRAC
jgi:hypothetical protein